MKDSMLELASLQEMHQEQTGYPNHSELHNSINIDLREPCTPCQARISSGVGGRSHRVRGYRCSDFRAVDIANE